MATEPTTTVNFTNAVYDTLKVGTIEADVSTINGISLGVYSNAAFGIANSANALANTANTTATAAFLKANSGYTLADTANTTGTAAFTKANSAYTLADTANTTATSAYAQANTANTNATTAISNANSASLYANTRPQNLQTANVYTLTIGDQGKHLYWPNSFGGNVSIYIPNNGQVSWPIGTEIKIISKVTTANLIITPNTSVNLYLAGNTTPASRNVNTYGVATIINTAANTWFMTGFGIGS